MAGVVIITDSTANLPDKFIHQYNITIVPLKVIWDGTSYDDGVDITPEDFYTRLERSQSMPSTSQVTVGEFKQVFEEFHSQGKEILAILLSSGISGTIDSAIQARESLPDAKIEIIDSLSTTMQLGFILLAGARCAQGGGSLDECKTAVEMARDNSGVVFAVDTLDFLHRGGRIGGGKRFLGTMLNIKPILTLHEGRVEALEQVRTRQRSLKRLVEIVAERTRDKNNLRIGVSHANAWKDAEELMALASSQLDPVEKIIGDLSPVLGTHAGPGTLALSYQHDA
jgi:DegV family protein with EDD domain